MSAAIDVDRFLTFRETIADLKDLAGELLVRGESVHDTSFGEPSVTVMTRPGRRIKAPVEHWLDLQRRTLRYGQPVRVEPRYAADGKLLSVKLLSVLI